mmetsp:Transcript_26276/g.84171  ORF Transcript_26276/g.84171 Transcript_26276/m.84171 type:complete len:206 (-) Transcript_26276:15-632(-)
MFRTRRSGNCARGTTSSPPTKPSPPSSPSSSATASTSRTSCRCRCDSAARRGYATRCSGRSAAQSCDQPLAPAPPSPSPRRRCRPPPRPRMCSPPSMRLPRCCRASGATSRRCTCAAPTRWPSRSTTRSPCSEESAPGGEGRWGKGGGGCGRRRDVSRFGALGGADARRGKLWGQREARERAMTYESPWACRCLRVVCGEGEREK